MNLYLGLDQGSSSTKAILIDKDFIIHFQSAVSIGTNFKNKNEVEQDPIEILNSIKILLDLAKSEAKKLNGKIESIGLSCQRSGVLAWDSKSGKVLYPLISWRDTRTLEVIEKVKDKALISNCTGLPLLPNYAASKISLLQKVFQEKNAVVGMLDTFLVNSLTEERFLRTEETFASRTLLYNLKSGNWDKDLCKLFKVDILRLQEISKSISNHGTIDGIPLKAVIGDQQSACIGVGGGILPTIVLGTVGSVLIPTSAKLIKKYGYISGVLFSKLDEGRNYYLEGTTNGCSETNDLIINKLKLCSSKEEIDKQCEESKAMNGENGPVAFFSLGGAGGVGVKQQEKAVFSESTKNDYGGFTRALVENLGGLLATQLLELSKAAEKSPNTQVVVTGGVSRSNYLLKYLAEITGFEILRPKIDSGSAFGAALLAMDSNPPLKGLTRQEVDRFKPSDCEISKARFVKWREFANRPRE